MIFVAGTISGTVKLAELNNKWQQKKESGNVLSKSELNKRDNWTQEQWLKNDFEEQLKRDKEVRKKTNIDNKIMSGETLTPEEERYLEEKDPVTLQRYRQTKIEKKAYEEKLRRCKTKDEVKRLKTETVSGWLSSFKKIEHNPYIPISEKLAKAQEMLAKSRNIEEAEKKFMITSEYINLPTEAEEEIDRAEEREIDDAVILDEIEKGSSDDESNGQNDSDSKIEMSEIEDVYNRIKLNVDLELGTDNVNVEHVAEAQKIIAKLLNDNHMVNEDIKGIEIDLNY